jgi:hypothetical protein
MRNTLALKILELLNCFNELDLFEYVYILFASLSIVIASNQRHPASAVVERVPAQRTARPIAALKPPEQATPMKTVPARSALLARQLSIFCDHTVANCALCLPLQRTYDIPLERSEPRYQIVVGESNDALRDTQPGLPFPLVQSNARDGGNRGLV